MIALVAYCGAFFCLGIAMSVLGPTLPHLAESVAVSIGSISILFAANAGGYLIGSYLAGPVFDHWRGHPVLAFTLGLLALLLYLVPSCGSLALLIVLFAALGILKGHIDVGGNTLLLWLYPTGAATPMNALHALFAVGAVVTPVVVGWALTKANGLDLAYGFLSVLIIPFALSFLLLPSPTAPALAARPTRASGGLGDLILISIFFFFYCGIEVGFGGWIYTYALRGGFEDASRSAFLTSTFWALFTLGRLGSISLARYVAPVRLVSIALTVSGLSLALMLILPESRHVLWIGSGLLGLAIAPIFPQVLLVADARLHLRGSTTRWFFVSASLGSIVIPTSLGQGFEFVGPQLLMPALLVILLAAVACHLLLLQRLKRPGNKG